MSVISKQCAKRRHCVDAAFMAYSISAMRAYPTRVVDTWDIRPSGYTERQVFDITKSIVEAYEDELYDYKFTPLMRGILVNRLVTIRMLRERNRVIRLLVQLSPAEAPNGIKKLDRCKMDMVTVMRQLRFGELTNVVVPRMYCFLTGENSEVSAVTVAGGEISPDSCVMALVRYGEYEAVSRGKDPVEALIKASMMAVKARPHQRVPRSEEAEPASVEADCDHDREDVESDKVRVIMDATQINGSQKWWLRYGPGDNEAIVMYSNTPEVFKTLEGEDDC